MTENKPDSVFGSFQRNQKKIVTWLGIFLGIALLGGLAFWTGISEITSAFQQAGPAVFLLVLLYPIELFPYAYAWYLLYPLGDLPRFREFVFGMWINNSVNRLLPTANFGGDIVRGRILIRKEYSAIDAISSLIADKTAQAVSILVLIIAGMLLTMTRINRWEIIGSLLVTALLLGIGIWFFVRLQRSSGVSRWLKRWEDTSEEGFLSNAGVNAGKVESRLKDIYNQPGRFIWSTTSRVLANVGLAIEIWIAAWLIGAPLSFFEAVTLRMVSFGIRNAAFVIWGGIGIQEGTYALLSAFVGLPPATLIAISLLTRVREILAALPGLITWLVGEGRSMLQTARS